MPRESRKDKKSFTGVYHIILRGINSQSIFLENMDREKFINEIKRTKEKYNYKLYAYVLMDNHLHMLIKEENESISKIMQSLATRYAMYFNKKYERIGHLFYNRFHSKKVETKNYLLNVQRYIHKNPQNEGMCKIEEYKWSSYQEYLENEKITDTDFILSFFDENKEQAIKLWKSYHSVNNENSYEEKNEFEIKRKLTDDEAIKKIKRKLKIENILEIQKYRIEDRDKIIKKICLIQGIRREQLARIIGISKRTIYRVIAKDK